MKQANNIVISLCTLLLVACGATTYKLISTGADPVSDIRFNVKHVLGCCGCSGVLVNTFQAGKLQSQLFIESNEGCPFAWTKYNFHYSSTGSVTRVDTLIAVADSSFTYPITNADKVALSKVDSFITYQSSSSYRLRKIDIKGYRNKTKEDADRLMVGPPKLDKHALY